MYEEKEELVSIMKQAAKERLQLERQLAIAKPGPVSTNSVRMLWNNYNRHIYDIYSKYLDICTWANNVDPAQTAPRGAV